MPAFPGPEPDAGETPAFPGRNRMRARRPRAIRAPDDGRADWFPSGADRATRVPRSGADGFAALAARSPSRNVDPGLRRVQAILQGTLVLEVGAAVRRCEFVAVARGG